MRKRLGNSGLRKFANMKKEMRRFVKLDIIIFESIPSRRGVTAREWQAGDWPLNRGPCAGTVTV